LTFDFIFVVDDLVIIGATPAGIEAALLAVHLKKRVALVQQPYSGNLEASEDIFSEGYSQISIPINCLIIGKKRPFIPHGNSCGNGCEFSANSPTFSQRN
jgi:hypothetical protein